jgi:hypothetical protein
MLSTRQRNASPLPDDPLGYGPVGGLSRKDEEKRQ